MARSHACREASDGGVLTVLTATGCLRPTGVPFAGEIIAATYLSLIAERPTAEEAGPAALGRAAPTARNLGLRAETR